MYIKIVADSGSDILELKRVPFASVPLKIRAGDREFSDTADANPEDMIAYLKNYKGKSGSACPSAGEWLEAFEDAENVFCVAMTSNLSGSYNAARVAAERYTEEFPERRVHVIDTLSAGSEMGLIIQKLEELITEKISFEEIVERITAYQQKTGLAVIIKSLHNFVQNGRVKPSVAVFASVLGICLVCEASAQGTLQPIKKVRGDKKAVRDAFLHMKEEGYCGGRVKIDHCRGMDVANMLSEQIRTEYPNAEIVIDETRLLCSYYAEEGGVLIGYEK